jgi:uncharacterized membrane protein (UPF0182 family)
LPLRQFAELGPRPSTRPLFAATTSTPKVKLAYPAIGRIGGLAVDWAWFSSIGYVSVFWMVFATKAVLCIVVFVVSSLLLWVNGALALRFASQRQSGLPAIPGFPTLRTSPETPSELLRFVSPLIPWRLLLLLVSLGIGLLIAIGEIGK